MIQKMRTLTAREKKIFFITAGFIIASLLYGQFFEPILAKNARLNAELRVSRSRLQKYLVLLEEKYSLQRQYPKFFSESSVIGKAAQESTVIFAELEVLAKGAHLAITDVRLGSAGDGRKGKAVAVEFRTMGTVEEHYKFLYDLESSLLLLKITGFTLTAKPRTSSVEGRFLITTMQMPRTSASVALDRSAGWDVN